jgi:hypothetical protein
MDVLRLRLVCLMMVLAITAPACSTATGCGDGRGTVGNGSLEDPEWRTNVPKDLQPFDDDDVVTAHFGFASALTDADRQLVVNAGGTIKIERPENGGLLADFRAGALRDFVAAYSGDRLITVHVAILGGRTC